MKSRVKGGAKVSVYVEGDSDRVALEALLKPIRLAAREKGRALKIFGKAGGKDYLLNTLPAQAPALLKSGSRDHIFALPDLYPMAKYTNTEARHQNCQELRQVILERFRKESEARGMSAEIQARFHVHCLKHDLEALILSVPELLRQRLGTSDALGKWRHPVEDQNDSEPPKVVVERLFRKYKPRAGYTETLDAPWILGRARLEDIEAACQQCFAPFIADLRVACGL